MIGITIDDLMDKLMHGHEAEFAYNGQAYSIESAIIDNRNMVKFWKCSEDEAACIAEVIVRKIEDLDELFKIKCFAEKSFYEIEAEIVVENVF